MTAAFGLETESFPGFIQYNIFNHHTNNYIKAASVKDSFINQSAVSSLIIENNGNILAGKDAGYSDNGSVEINVKTGIVSRISLEKKLLKKKDNYIEYSSNNDISTIHKDENGNIYVSTVRRFFAAQSLLRKKQSIIPGKFI